MRVLALRQAIALLWPWPAACDWSQEMKITFFFNLLIYLNKKSFLLLQTLIFCNFHWKYLTWQWLTRNYCPFFWLLLQYMKIHITDWTDWTLWANRCLWNQFFLCTCNRKSLASFCTYWKVLLTKLKQKLQLRAMWGFVFNVNLSPVQRFSPSEAAVLSPFTGLSPRHP